MRRAVLLGGMALFVIAASWLSIDLLVDGGDKPIMWLANAAPLALLLRSRIESWPAVLAVAGAAIFAGVLAAGASPLAAAPMALLHLIEIVLAAVILRRLGGDGDLTRMAALAALLIASVAAPIPSALAGAALAGPDDIRAFLAEAAQWLRADALGLMLLLPPLAAIGRPRATPPGRWPRDWETLAVIAGSGVATAAVFVESDHSLLFLIPPFLTLAAFRLRLPSVAMCILLIAMVALFLTAQGYGPIAGGGGGAGARALFLQGFLAVAVCTTYPVSAALAERARLAFSLRSSERHYRLLAENTQDMIVVLAPDGLVEFVSPACRQLLGHEPQDLIGATAAEGVHPDDRHLIDGVPEELRARGSAIRSYRQRRRDGTMVWVETSFRLVGAGDRIVGAVRDVTARRAAEMDIAAAARELSASHEMLLIAESTAGLGHWRIDVATRTIMWSDQMYRIYGVPTSFEPTVESIMERHHPDDRETFRRELIEEARSRRDFDFQTRVVRPDGTIVDVAIRGEAEVDAAGEVVRLFGITQDVTAQLAVQRELIAARDAAEEAVRAKATFLATMSHEIRTPMTGVLGMIELLRLDPPEEQRRRYYDTLEQSARTLMTVVDDVLDYSKLEAGRVVIEEIEFDLAALVESTASLFRSTAEAKGLTLRVKLKRAPAGPMRGDPTRIQQILSNLLSNATKFTNSGEIRVSVKPDGTPGEGRWRIAVRDTGIGIDAETIERLFRPFEQGDASTTRRFGGTGLGLAISRQLAEAMGGTISVESVPGVGSSFRLTLPLAPARPAVAAEVPPVAATSGDGLAVLVAEDNPVNQLLISSMLGKLGHRVTMVENGRLAMEAAAADAFDLILMDMEMPEMDGLAATRAIRARGGASARAPIVALTADALPERRGLYEDAGLGGFLAKPFDLEQLRGAIEEALAEADAGGAPLLDPVVLGDLEAALSAEAVVQLLEMLATQLRDTPGRIVAAMRQGQAEEACRLAHGLRGAAVSLGAARLSELLVAVEAGIGAANGHQPTPGAMPTVARSTLVRVEEEIARRHEAAAVAGPEA